MEYQTNNKKNFKSFCSNKKEQILEAKMPFSASCLPFLKMFTFLQIFLWFAPSNYKYNTAPQKSRFSDGLE